MPIYEFACPKCRRIFNFLSKRMISDRLPTCPKCGNKKMVKQMSRFATTKGLKEPAAKGDADAGDEGPMPDFDDPRMMRAMSELERDMEHLDENNPKHMAHMMRKMKDIMPPGTVPRNSMWPSNGSKRAKTRKRSRKTWAICSAILWADPGVKAAPAATRMTAGCTTISFKP